MNQRQLSSNAFAVLLLLIASAGLADETDGKKASLSKKDPRTKRQLGKLNKKEQNVLKYTNLARKQQDKPALTAVSHLTVIAQEHAINMAAQRMLSHELDDKSVKDRLDDVSYVYRAFAENIAEGYASEKRLVQGWLNSPGHRKNLLDEGDMGYTQIGIGAHRGRNGRWYYCQVFARPASGKQYE